MTAYMDLMMVIFTSYDSSANLLDSTTDLPLVKVSISSHKRMFICAHSGPVEHIATHPTQQIFATGSGAKILIWETNNGNWCKLAALVPSRSPELGPCKFLVHGIGFRPGNQFSALYMHHGLGYEISLCQNLLYQPVYFAGLGILLHGDYLSTLR